MASYERRYCFKCGWKWAVWKELLLIKAKPNSIWDQYECYPRRLTRSDERIASSVIDRFWNRDFASTQRAHILEECTFMACNRSLLNKESSSFLSSRRTVKMSNLLFWTATLLLQCQKIVFIWPKGRCLEADEFVRILGITDTTNVASSSPSPAASQRRGEGSMSQLENRGHNQSITPLFTVYHNHKKCETSIIKTCLPCWCHWPFL